MVRFVPYTPVAMALHPDFPASPYEIADPAHRWFPADEALRSTAYEKLLPPLVARIREEVGEWRAAGYPGASATSQALLRHWFQTEHLIAQADGSRSEFRYYFAQREAVETVVWLYDVRKARDKYDLIRFDASNAVAAGMFPENWPRYVCKMATGSGKTKVLSLLIAWSFFHKLYERESGLARNILLIAPNIIVLDRLRADFDGLRIFFEDPVLPHNGHEGRNWQDDFQLTLHIQDDVRVVRPTGNLFLTNVHRVYLGDVHEPSLEDEDLSDYFLGPFGPKPAGKTTDSRTDLGEIVREVEELAVFNDEAHHIHDERMAWFKSIEDIHHRMLQKGGSLSLQLDVTATPKRNDGSIFAQTVSDYPLVEAIHQNAVKHPTLPDQPSIERLQERNSAIFTEHYEDYLRLGIEEWRQSYAEHEPLGKKAVLFVMVDDTRNCDEVGAWLRQAAPELENGVLVIHTKKNGDISEAAGSQNEQELKRLRQAANEIDRWDNPCKAIVSVLMLKEGWDVRNVTTIVGLRAYNSRAKILPEQTLGRGLRRMYFGNDAPEYVSVMGTHAFIEFVESIKEEGVELERKPMGDGRGRPDSLVIEVDAGNDSKDLDALDIAVPRLSRRFNREYRELDAVNPAEIGGARIALKSFPPEEMRQIVFKTILEDEVHHTIELTGTGTADWRSAIGFFARQLLKELKLVGGYDLLYPKVRDFVRERLFEGQAVNLEDPVVLRNLAEPEAASIVFDTFKAAINRHTVQESAVAEVVGYIRTRDMRPFRVTNRKFLTPSKSVFNKIVGEAAAGGFEREFAAFLEGASDVISFARNYLALGFKLDYVKANGDLSHYVPDFLVKTTDGVWIVETKGRAELDLPQKMLRLSQWCTDATEADATGTGTVYRFVYVGQEGYERNPPRTFDGLVRAFTEYQP